MTQRRRIAISYLFAVPAVLAIVLVQHIAILRLRSAESEMARTAEVLRRTKAGSPLGQAEPPGKSGASIQAQTAAQTQGQTAATVDTKLPAGNSAAPSARLAEQRQIADASVHFAEIVNTFSGILTIWLVGVAAFLLFHDEKARAWTGGERRVHTRIIETLPLGVCLSTVSGGILYTNVTEDSIFGYEREDLIGKDVARLHGHLPSAPGLTLEAAIDGLAPGQTWSGEVNIQLKDGSNRKTQAWITNLEVAGKLYRLFVHNPVV